MNALFAIGILTLIGCTLGGSSLNNWGKSPVTLGKNDVASSYLNTLEICPQEVPRCPGKAEPRCYQDSPHVGSPTQKNTQWRCVLCETNGSEGPACFVVIPIETYAAQRPRKPKNQKTSEGENLAKAGGGNGAGNKKRNANTGQLQTNGTSQPQKSFKPYLDGKAGQPSGRDKPRTQPQNIQPLTTLLGGGIQNNRPPSIAQEQRPYQPPIQQSNINQPLQQPYAPNGYVYPQRSYMPYGAPMVNSYRPQPNAFVQAPYVPQTNPYLQPQYPSAGRYNTGPQLRGFYSY